MEMWLSPFWRYGYDMATVDKVVRNIYIYIYITNKCIYVDICLIILIYLFIHGFIYI